MNMKKYFEQGMLHLLEKKSIDGITVGEIIEEVGSCKGTFYKHYVDKYYLCCSSLQSLVYGKIDCDTCWEEFIMQCLSVFEGSAKIILHAFNSKDVNSARYYHEKLTTEYLLKQYVKNGGDASASLNLLTIKLYGAAVTEIIIKWLSEGCKQSKADIYKLICAVTPQTVFKEICVQSA